MAFKTPLERALESGLEMLGMPFDGRSVVSEAAIDGYLARQAVPPERIEKVADPRLREIMRQKIAQPPDFSIQIVYRMTGHDGGLLQVQYAVHPSEENERSFSRVRDYSTFDALVDKILESRSFDTEEIYVMPDSLYTRDGEQTITQEEIQDMRVDLFTNPNMMPSREDIGEALKEAEENFDDRGLYIGFHTDGIEKSQSPDVPEGIFTGIKSPTKDAEKLAFRICLYLHENRQRINKQK